MILSNASFVICGDGTTRRRASVIIDSAQITDIVDGSVTPRDPDEEVVNCDGLLLMPGLINAHNHVFQIVCRGIGREYRVHDWLTRVIYPVTSALDDDDYYHVGVIGAADAMATGCSGVVSHLTNFARFHAAAEARAFKSVGIRACVARGISTHSTMDSREDRSVDAEFEAINEFLSDWDGDDLIQAAVGPSNLWVCDEDTLRKTKETASAQEVPFLIHLAETEVRAAMSRNLGFRGEVDRAEKLGLLDEMTVVAHAVWIDQAEIGILAKRGCTVAHNPTSNMVLASGAANVKTMLAEGVNLALGSDGPASNDSQDMIAEMKTALLLSRVTTLSPESCSPRDVFSMATRAGRNVMGASQTSGLIQPDATADIIGLQVRDNLEMEPVTHPLESVVLCGNGRDVSLNVIEGEVRYLRGSFALVDPLESLNYVREVSMPKVRRALGIDP